MMGLEGFSFLISCWLDFKVLNLDFTRDFTLHFTSTKPPTRTEFDPNTQSIHKQTSSEPHGQKGSAISTHRSVSLHFKNSYPHSSLLSIMSHSSLHFLLHASGIGKMQIRMMDKMLVKFLFVQHPSTTHSLYCFLWLQEGPMKVAAPQVIQTRQCVLMHSHISALIFEMLTHQTL